MENLFKGSRNILGILMRGTDYLAKKPKHKPIPPSIETVFKDIMKMDKKNKYDFYFIATEDILIKNKFINKFREKLKYILFENDINYDYKKKEFLALNENIRGNLGFIKIYILNIIILSKCIDIISARTNGLYGLIILSNGFRNAKIYFLGEYN